MSRYGNLVGDPSGYNPSRSLGTTISETSDIVTLVENISNEGDRGGLNAPRDVERVRDWLDQHGVPLHAVNVYEHPAYGTVQIEKTGYIGDFEQFLHLMRNTDGVSYDGDVNYCESDWAAEL